jgi:hypothetical protein
MFYYFKHRTSPSRVNEPNLIASRGRSCPVNHSLELQMAEALRKDCDCSIFSVGSAHGLHGLAKIF